MGLRSLVVFDLEAMLVLLSLALGEMGMAVRVLLSLDLAVDESVLLSLDFVVGVEMVTEKGEMVELVFFGLSDLVLFIGARDSETGFFLGGVLDLRIGELRSSLFLLEIVVGSDGSGEDGGEVHEEEEDGGCGLRGKEGSHFTQ
ncbi:hypothetical protein M5K25_023078 [Dendrobium thyrsiflorum]|uniref:Uncharacterized protein n=1 Tax=Dendrobium thyrsiflorum TaxID=117978 RepID=A0ABD0UDY2_DENTH